MPEGENISERVRLSGIFLKLYPYVPEKAQRMESDEPHLAPLVIGRDVTWIGRQQQSHSQWALIVTGLFLLLLGGIAVWSWRTRRTDAQARARIIGRQTRSGASGLDELKLD
jgi:hypothetical protein